MQAQKRLSSADVNRVYREAYKVKMDFKQMPDNISEFLTQYSISRSTTVSHMMCTVLPLTASLMGPKVGTKVTALNVVPCNIYMMNVCAKGGGKTATFQNILLKGLDAVGEDGPKMLLENYTTQGFQVRCPFIEIF